MPATPGEIVVNVRAETGADEQALDTLRYPLIRAAISNSIWAIEPAKLAEILAFIDFKARGGTVSAEEIQARFGGRERPQTRASGAVAVLPLFGTISHRMGSMSEFSGGTSTEMFTKQFRELLSDDTVGAIVLDVDSPGGVINGVPELAAEIFRARGTKPITAVANSLMASAAYWIASAADEVVVIPSGDVGSIGVFTTHTDRSAAYEQAGLKVTVVSAGKYKSEGNPHSALEEEARAAIQERVDESYDMFVKAVAKHRKVGVDQVRNGYGEGRVVGARQAVSLGMADRVATLDEVISGLTGRRNNNGQKSAAADTSPAPVAIDGDLDIRRRQLAMYAAHAADERQG